jgi:hypothetical protein
MSQIRLVLSLLAFAVSLALLGAAAGLLGVFLRSALGLVSRLLR